MYIEPKPTIEVALLLHKLSGTTMALKWIAMIKKKNKSQTLQILSTASGQCHCLSISTRTTLKPRVV